MACLHVELLPYALYYFDLGISSKLKKNNLSNTLFNTNPLNKKLLPALLNTS